MALELRRAERRKAKLRIGVFGPSGSGKTMSSLLIAHGITQDWSKICLIDTENGSGDLYSHLGEYNTIQLAPPYAPEQYVEAIKIAEKAGMEVIVIDSITHEWSGTGGMLEIADSLLPSMRDGRQIWTKITPRHNKFIDAILQSNAHVICCGRSKQETVMVESERNGRKVQVPEKVGLKAITREGFDYEMTVAFDIAINHYATCTKDRTKGDDGRALFQDKSPRVLDHKVGEQLRTWSEDGKDDPVQVRRDIIRELERLGLALPSEATEKGAFIRDAVKKITAVNLMADKDYAEALNVLRVIAPEQAAAAMAPEPIEVPGFETPDEEPAPEPSVSVEPPAPQAAPAATPTPEPPLTTTGERDIVYRIDQANKIKTNEEAVALIQAMRTEGDRESHLKVITGTLEARGFKV